MNLQEAFERHGDEFLHFERIENPKHPRPDVCAFLMLHELVPGTKDIVNGAGRGELFLCIDLEALADVATDDFIRDIRRCGVIYDSETNSLAMFV